MLVFKSACERELHFQKEISGQQLSHVSGCMFALGRMMSVKGKSFVRH